MTPPTFTKCPCAFPAHWSPEQAVAVADFLSDLREAIWLHYYEEMDEAYRRRSLSDYFRPGDAPDGNSSGAP